MYLFNGMLPILVESDDPAVQMTEMVKYLKIYRQEHEIILETLNEEIDSLKKRIKELESEKRITITDVVGSSQFKKAIERGE